MKRYTFTIPFWLPSRRTPGRVFTKGVQMHHSLFGGGADNVLTRTPSDTRDNINELIPTFEEIEGVKDAYITQQVMQEFFMHGLRLAVPGGVPVKIGLEAYSLYDYFN